MNTLQELNNYGRLTVDVIDLNPSGVVFDRGRANPGPVNYLFNADAIAGSYIVVPEPGINILEVRNYQTANVRYRVRILGNPTVTGSNVSWGPLPAGVNLTVNGNTYTLTGINSKTIWDEVKYFTWSIPSNYNAYNAFYLDVAVIYYDSAQEEDITTDWEVYDPNYYEIAALTGTANMVTVNRRIKQLSSAMSATFTPSFEIRNIKITGSSMSTISNMVCEPIDSAFVVNSTIFAGGVRNRRYNAVMASNVSVTATIDEILDNMIDRTYNSNNVNNIFAVNTPQIMDVDATYTITLSCPIGKFSTSDTVLPVSPYSFTGTKSQVNSIFSQIKFYPNPGISSNSTITYTQTKNGILQLSQTINLTGTSTSFNGFATYTYTSSSSFTPKYSEAYYGVADLLIVGGGGGGGDNGGGGGGGQVREIFSYAMTPGSSSAVVVGNGGAGSSITETGSSTDSGADGGNSSVYGYVSNGGKGGGGYFKLDNYPPDYPTQPFVYRYKKSGGNSGSGNTGGAYQGVVFSSGQTYLRGGGGGGASTAGTAGPNGNGGSGYFSSITSTIYGGGGAGMATGSPGNGGGGAVGVSANANTGGGGGAATTSSNPGNGGSGIVVIKIR